LGVTKFSFNINFAIYKTDIKSTDAVNIKKTNIFKSTRISLFTGGTFH